MRASDIYDRVERNIATNRKARYEFEIVQVLEAGIMLQGTEVKSLRAGKCSMADAYAGFKSVQENELWLMNLHINEYEHGNRENHLPKRPRKLLINAKEAKKIHAQVKEKGVTLIPLSIYFSGHIVKIELGVCKSKHKYDKRETTKERESKREIDRKYKFK